MSTTKSFSGNIQQDGFEEPGFDVTYETVVGRVSYNGDGKLNPIQAAFLVIEKTQKDGTYRFPGPHADTDVVVTVDGMEYREEWDAKK